MKQLCDGFAGEVEILIILLYMLLDFLNKETARVSVSGLNGLHYSEQLTGDKPADKAQRPELADRAVEIMVGKCRKRSACGFDPF